MLTAMICRMERRTVVAAMVGANCSMDETLDAIWAEVTIQSSALLPVLRLMALRAMKRLEKHYEGIGRARHSFYVIQASKLDFRDGGLPPRDGNVQQSFSAASNELQSSLASLNRGKRGKQLTISPKTNTIQHSTSFLTLFCQLQHSSKSLSSLSNRAM